MNEMKFEKRYRYIMAHFKAIGIITTFSYFLQRIFLRKHQLIKLNVSGLQHCLFLRNKTFDVHIFYRIFVRRELEFNIEKNVKCILDLGANIGLASLFFARKFPDAKITCIEPEKNNFKLLHLSTCKYNNIRTMRAAVSGVSGSGFVNDLNKGEDSYFITFQTGIHVIDEVETYTIKKLKSFLNTDSFDLVKMDIEGAEYDCFENKDWVDSVNCLALEFHNEPRKGLRTDIDEFMRKQFAASFQNEYVLYKKLSH